MIERLRTINDSANIQPALTCPVDDKLLRMLLRVSKSYYWIISRWYIHHFLFHFFLILTLCCSKYELPFS